MGLRLCLEHPGLLLMPMDCGGNSVYWSHERNEITVWGEIILNYRKFAIYMVGGLFMASGNISATASADENGNDFQRNALFQPSERQLEREAGGSVFIYDGLTDREVDRAMDQQPERIKAMMFVRTKKTDVNGELARDPQTGDVIAEEDGCDD